MTAWDKSITPTRRDRLDRWLEGPGEAGEEYVLRWESSPRGDHPGDEIRTISELRTASRERAEQTWEQMVELFALA